MIRPAAVAGRFYPDDPQELSDAIRGYLAPATDRVQAIGIVVPHAGYMYSGHVAGAVYARLQMPGRAIGLCPNHTGLGPPLSIRDAGAWQTPLGDVDIDPELIQSLMASDPLLNSDTQAHRFEHALEVQLPFIQFLSGPSFRFAPITVGTGRWEHLEALGNAMAAAVREKAPGATIIASSDMNHYEPDRVTRVKDRKAIDRILDLDPEGLFDVVQRERISMCGFGPTTAMLVAAKQLGASKAELVQYATSGDVSGDFDRVVGYAGIIVR